MASDAELNSVTGPLDCTRVHELVDVGQRLTFEQLGALYLHLRKHDPNCSCAALVVAAKRLFSDVDDNLTWIKESNKDFSSDTKQ